MAEGDNRPYLQTLQTNPVHTASFSCLCGRFLTSLEAKEETLIEIILRLNNQASWKSLLWADKQISKFNLEVQACTCFFSKNPIGMITVLQTSLVLAYPIVATVVFHND
jgi:hypothetical protein